MHTPFQLTNPPWAKRGPGLAHERERLLGVVAGLIISIRSSHSLYGVAAAADARRCCRCVRHQAQTIRFRKELSQSKTVNAPRPARTPSPRHTTWGPHASHLYQSDVEDEGERRRPCDQHKGNDQYRARPWRAKWNAPRLCSVVTRETLKVG